MLLRNLVKTMTKVAICYESRYGTTTEIVQEMAKYAEEAEANVEVVELKKNKLSSECHTPQNEVDISSKTIRGFPILRHSGFL